MKIFSLARVFYAAILGIRRKLSPRVKYHLFNVPVLITNPDQCGYFVGKKLEVWGCNPSRRVRPYTPETTCHWKFGFANSVGTSSVYEHKDIWCTELRSPVVLGFNGAVLDGGATVWHPGYEYPFYPNGDGVEVAKLFIPRACNWGDTLTLIDCPAGGSNLFHWMTEALPRIDIVRRYTEEMPVVLVRDKLAPFAQEMLGYLGIQWKLIKRNEGVTPKRLIFASMPGVWGNPPDFVIQWLRDEFLWKAVKERSGMPRRVYISRRGTRRVRNEEGLLRILHRRGIKRVFLEDLPFREQVELFANVELVVAPHGAALTHLVFCRPGTRVIELFSPSYVNVCYWAIANHRRLKYSYMLGEGAEPPEGVDPHLIREDIIVDPTKVDDWIETLESV